MSRSICIAGALAVMLTLGLKTDAYAQQPTLEGSASCIDAQGTYTITWTLTLTLGEQEMASAESPMRDFDGIDLIGQPQGENYPFSTESGNIFTREGARLVNGPNVARTRIDTRAYDPDTLTASGWIITPAGSTEVEATVSRPQACPA